MSDSNSRPLGLRLALSVVLLSFGATLVAADPPQDYVVFVGLRPTVKHAGQDCPVIQVGRGRVEVVAHGRQVSLPMDTLQRLETRSEPKISSLEIEVAEVQTRRGFGGMDPSFDKDHQQILLSTMAAQGQTIALNEWKTADSNVRMTEAAVAHGLARQSALVAAEEQRGEAAAGFDAAVADATHFATAGSDLAEGGAPDRFDALNFSARLSAPHEIEGAFGLLRVLVRDPLNPRAPIPTVRLVPLPKIGPEARKVTAVVRGLPKGFSVDRCELHVFAGERELATNLSSNRLNVTQDEAHQFLVLKYLGANASATVPPQVIPELISPQLAGSIGEEQRSLAVDFAVDREGVVTNITTPALADPLPEGLVRALRAVRFYPALVKGAPTDSSGTFALGELLP